MIRKRLDFMLGAVQRDCGSGEAEGYRQPCYLKYSKIVNFTHDKSAPTEAGKLIGS